MKNDKMKLLDRKAQSTIEYAVLIGIVTAALITMWTYTKRSIQGRLKQVEEELDVRPPRINVEQPQ
jgi:Flp pilus assembly pilin Flp